MRGPYGTNRLALRISDHVVNGSKPVKDPQELLHFFNNTNSEITIRLEDGKNSDEYLVYPLTLSEISRPSESGKVIIERLGVKLELNRSQLNRKMNAIYSGEEIDMSKYIISYQMWRHHILSMSDKINMGEKSATIMYKSPDDVGNNVYSLFLIGVIIVQVIILISVGSCFVIYK
jgi:hypothetical protein